MGEGTKVFNTQEEIADLKRRLEALERWQAPIPMPVGGGMGCICPAGAERGCGNAFCPRRTYPGTIW